jgi:hypothetical protein
MEAVMSKYVAYGGCTFDGCQEQALYILKLHRHSEPLLSPPSDALCNDHVLDRLTGMLEEMDGDRDAFSIGIMRA